MFKCYYCGKEYETPERAAHCTLSCGRKRRADVETLRVQIPKKLAEVRDLVNRYNLLSNAVEITINITTNYINIDRATTLDINEYTKGFVGSGITDDEDVNDSEEDIEDESEEDEEPFEPITKLTLPDVVKLLRTIFEEDD